MDESSGPKGSSLLARTKEFLIRPIVAVLVVGLAIRLAIAPLMTMGYDVYHWALVISNFQGGNGLYQLPGYYYVPVWGYILGFISVLQDFIFSIPVFGERFIEAFSIEFGGHTNATATITTIRFNVTVKIILFVADVLVGYLIYVAIRNHTGSESKATTGFALWFLCPIVIIISSACGMFDAFSVLFLFLATVLAYRSQYILAGSMFCMSILTKFFPVFFLAFFIIFILIKHREDGTARRHIAESVFGAGATAILVYIPQIMDGTIVESLSFITGRVGGGLGTGLGDIEVFGTIVGFVLIFILTTLIALDYRKKKDQSFETMIRYMLLTATVILLYPPAPQYVLIILPFLIIYIVVSDRSFMIPWILLSIFVTSSALTSNFTQLLSLGAYSDIIDLKTVVDFIETYRSTVILGINVESIIYFSLGVLQYISILSVLYFLLRRNKEQSVSDRRQILNE